ncbi:AraC family transcriptional regulator [Nocardia uniformis]|uniref:AraC family transcriptional regulator n=2 Tax=Nocardia uniformis TaxID=53432 RepID=A0A849C3B8_9NOCA|nr:AraC family transcriptional regulator ligand-binding domain-containing protein [Nocardia uniformis]NNH73184.1 AraC family transcriptional regulator [Nocardia uniformis]
MARFVLGWAGSAGFDPDRLARAAGVPSWTEGGESKRISRRYFTRLWELLEQESGDPEIALRVATDTAIGHLGLLEYLFLSAPTLGAAIDTCIRHFGSLTTSYALRIAHRTDAEVTYELLCAPDDSRGRELLMHAAFALLTTRARAATRARVDPVRLTFRQPTIGAVDAFIELFGTSAIEFGAVADTLTLRAADLELPVTTADPTLSAVLHGYAATMPAPPEFTVTLIDRLAAALDVALAEGPVTLDAVARRLLTSPRSLQRRLAESGTSWRRELDRARRRRLENVADLPRARQAELLGYSDPASLRRSVQRWRDRP